MKKKLLEISPFYICLPKTKIIWGAVPEIWSETNFLSFWAIFALYPSPPNYLENQNFEKMEKNIWSCYHFKLVQQKTQSNDVCLLRYGVQQT